MPEAILTFQSATQNAVVFKYGGTGWNVPKDGSESSVSWGAWTTGDLIQQRTGQSKQTVYNESSCRTKWNWQFVGGNGGSSSEKEGTKTITGFLSGRKNTISGTLKASRTSKIKIRTYRQSRTREKNQDGSYTAWSTGEKQLTNTKYEDGADKDIGTATKTLTFYTRPDEFFWDVSPSKDVSIYLVLTAAKWNELMDKAVQRYNWKYCQQNSGNTPRITGQNQVAPGMLISADIYNSGALLCGIDTRVTAKQSVIYASLFTALSSAVNAS